MRVTVEFLDGEEVTSNEITEVPDWKGYIEGFGDEIGVVIHTGPWVRIIPWSAIKQLHILKEDK